MTLQFRALAEEAATGGEISPEGAEAMLVAKEEDTWLQGQIDANDVIDEYDEALLAFLKEETGG